jgi:hypothetical protein
MATTLEEVSDDLHIRVITFAGLLGHLIQVVCCIS